MFNKILPMTGVEPRTSDIESNRSTNWATIGPIQPSSPLTKNLHGLAKLKDKRFATLLFFCVLTRERLNSFLIASLFC